MLKDSACQLVAILDPAEEAIELCSSDRQGQLIIGEGVLSCAGKIVYGN